MITDLESSAKLADIVGLYLDPPGRVLVPCVDQNASCPRIIPQRLSTVCRKFLNFN